MLLVKKLDNKFVFIAGRKDPTIGSAVVFNGNKPLRRKVRRNHTTHPNWKYMRFRTQTTYVTYHINNKINVLQIPFIDFKS